MIYNIMGFLWTTAALAVVLELWTPNPIVVATGAMMGFAAFSFTISRTEG